MKTNLLNNIKSVVLFPFAILDLGHLYLESYLRNRQTHKPFLNKNDVKEAIEKMRKDL